jgi:hypothetical protein
MLRGSNPGGGEIFRTCPYRPWGPSIILYNGYRVFPGGRKRPERYADSARLLVPRSKNRVEVYLYCPEGTSCPVKRVLPTYNVNFLCTFLWRLFVLRPQAVWIPCARQRSNFKFYVLQRPDDDFLKVETCSLVYDKYIYMYVVLDGHIQINNKYTVV